MARAFALLAVLLGLLIADGCGGSDDKPEAAPAEPTATAGTEAAAAEPPPATTAGEAPQGPEDTVTSEETELEPGLPEDIAGYVSWIVLSAEPIPPREDGDAHLGTKNVYASEAAAANRVYPNGTIVVKEAVRPDADFIGLVAIMRKLDGFDPAHNNWEFVEYTRAGADEAFTRTASGEVCWSCHMGAAQTDYVWIATLGLTK